MKGRRLSEFGWVVLASVAFQVCLYVILFR